MQSPLTFIFVACVALMSSWIEAPNFRGQYLLDDGTGQWEFDRDDLPVLEKILAQPNLKFSDLTATEKKTFVGIARKKQLSANIGGTGNTTQSLGAIRELLQGKETKRLSAVAAKPPRPATASRATSQAVFSAARTTPAQTAAAPTPRRAEVPRAPASSARSRAQQSEESVLDSAVSLDASEHGVEGLSSGLIDRLHGWKSAFQESAQLKQFGADRVAEQVGKLHESYDRMPLDSRTSAAQPGTPLPVSVDFATISLQQQAAERASQSQLASSLAFARPAATQAAFQQQLKERKTAPITLQDSPLKARLAGLQNHLEVDPDVAFKQASSTQLLQDLRARGGVQYPQRSAAPATSARVTPEILAESTEKTAHDEAHDAEVAQNNAGRDAASPQHSQQAAESSNVASSHSSIDSSSPDQTQSAETSGTARQEPAVFAATPPLVALSRAPAPASPIPVRAASPAAKHDANQATLDMGTPVASAATDEAAAAEHTRSKVASPSPSVLEHTGAEQSHQSSSVQGLDASSAFAAPAPAPAASPVAAKAASPRSSDSPTGNTETAAAHEKAEIASAPDAEDGSRGFASATVREIAKGDATAAAGQSGDSIDGTKHSAVADAAVQKKTEGSAEPSTERARFAPDGSASKEAVPEAVPAIKKIPITNNPLLKIRRDAVASRQSAIKATNPIKERKKKHSIGAHEQVSRTDGASAATDASGHGAAVTEGIDAASPTADASHNTIDERTAATGKVDASLQTDEVADAAPAPVHAPPAEAATSQREEEEEIPTAAKAVSSAKEAATESASASTGSEVNPLPTTRRVRFVSESPAPKPPRAPRARNASYARSFSSSILSRGRPKIDPKKQAEEAKERTEWLHQMFPELFKKTLTPEAASPAPAPAAAPAPHTVDSPSSHTAGEHAASSASHTPAKVSVAPDVSATKKPMTGLAETVTGAIRKNQNRITGPRVTPRLH